MSPFTYNTAIVQDNNLFGIHNRTDPLGYQKDRAGPGFPLQSPPQVPIGLQIKGGKAVIKKVDWCIFYQRSGNGQTLPLASGNIGAALGDDRVKAFILGRDKYGGLGNLGCLG